MMTTENNMYRENYIESLRKELVELVEQKLTPISLKYHYSDVGLEANIKWRPIVLVLGNYSSGKSTLINELLGFDVQTTGQAPTDDSFTVITCDDNPAAETEDLKVTETRDGKSLLSDSEFPFETFKKHGQRFSAHFRLKKVNSPLLSHLAIIDTPGMLDSIAERDRGYDYQQVIGDFAHMADLVLVLFDPHKAGTVRETYASLRDTLPSKTFEDRVVFVMNRIDECSNLNDLLRVYGTLCWNLSQMVGRKDIPPILLTYSPSMVANSTQSPEFLNHLANQRSQLTEMIMRAPQSRLSNLATYVETHAERLEHILETLINYRKKKLYKLVKFVSKTAFVTAVLAGALCSYLFWEGSVVAGGYLPLLFIGLGGWLAAAGLFLMLTLKIKLNSFHQEQMQALDSLTSLKTQARKDTWSQVRKLTFQLVEDYKSLPSMAELRRDFNQVKLAYKKGTTEIRKAINEIQKISGPT